VNLSLFILATSHPRSLKLNVFMFVHVLHLIWIYLRKVLSFKSLIASKNTIRAKFLFSETSIFLNTLNTFENTRAFSSRIFVSKYQLQISVVLRLFVKKEKMSITIKRKLKIFFYIERQSF